MPDYKARYRALHTREGARVPVKAELPTVRGDSSTAIIRLYDAIDSWGEWWGISAKEFTTVLDELPPTITEIQLLINSPGGEVFDGIAILNALRRHPARVVAIVEGIAASIASDIAVGCDELVMAPNSELMIHDTWGMCVGNAQDMRQFAEELDHLSDNIASVYATKAGGTVEQWRDLMRAETWYTAEEAVAAGLADRVDTDVAVADGAKNRFDLSVFNFAGRAHAPGPQQNPVVDPGGGPNNNPSERSPAVAFSDEQLNHMRQRLGLADDADEATILAAIDSTLDEFVEPDNQPTAPTPPAPSAALPAGVVAISETVLAGLQANAQAGVEARTEQIVARRTGLVQAAINDGRIAPAERDGWLAKLTSTDGVSLDENAANVLATLKPGLIPVNERGHADDPPANAGAGAAEELQSFNDRRFGRTSTRQGVSA